MALHQDAVIVSEEERNQRPMYLKLPALLDLPTIQRAPPTVSGSGGRVDLAEGCMLTRSVKYTHQLVHWVNAVRHGDPGPIEDIIEDMLIIPYRGFTLNDTCNLAFRVSQTSVQRGPVSDVRTVESFVHTSLDLYAFIAVTASSSTLEALITMVKSENDRQQREMDESGFESRRSLDFTNWSIADPEYELVAIHPEHFLPGHAPLTVYDSATATYKNYVSATDQRLRESIDPNSPRFPAFHFRPPTRRHYSQRLNVFLVLLNAEIKFRRYLEMIQTRPPTTTLPADIHNLMHRTIDLVDLLYWRPVPTKGSQGEAVYAARIAEGRRREKRPDPMKSIEKGSSDEMEEDAQNPLDSGATAVRRRRFHWPADMDLEERMAYGRELMSGHGDIDYDPALFEDAFPINDTINLYSKKGNVEAWKQGVSTDG